MKMTDINKQRCNLWKTEVKAHRNFWGRYMHLVDQFFVGDMPDLMMVVREGLRNESKDSTELSRKA